MAIMIPNTYAEDIQDGEKKLYSILELGLGDEMVCYHHRDIKGAETEFIIVWPNEGICVIEVKDWDGTELECNINNSQFKYYNHKSKSVKTEDSPLNQCKSYTYKVREVLGEQLDLNVKVVPIVCFPFMTEYLYREKKVDKIISRERIILSDDLEEISQFRYVLKEKFDKKVVKRAENYSMEQYVSICSNWEDEQNIRNRLYNLMDCRKVDRCFQKRYYSSLSFIRLKKDEKEFEKQMYSYYLKWITGCKVILIMDNQEDVERVMLYLSKIIKEKISYITRYKEFRVMDSKGIKNRIFNFEVYSGEIPDEEVEFEIIDGEDFLSYDGILKNFDKCTDFNYGQYQIEHANPDKNVLVKAGAGTGKTTSMIARIGFLYYINKYTPEKLLKTIIMITFTNEAADNMKVKLKEYFMHLAVLTEDSMYIRLMENISRMQISTIHSLMKKIIEKYASYLGVGSRINITTEVFERREIIHEILSGLITQTQYNDFIKRGIKKYNIRKAVEKLLDLLEKKNIDLQEKQNFAGIYQEQELFNLILEIAQTTQKEIALKHIGQNKVHLSNLTIELKVLLQALERERSATSEIEYVFVDEFQDTDDVTIELIQRFKELFKFKLFVVGDIKQSIYRFRGADDEAFNKLASKISNWVIQEQINPINRTVKQKEYLTLNKNYRSDGKLLKEFDEIFQTWAKGINDYKEVFKYAEDDRLENSRCTLGKEPLIKPIECTPQEFKQKLENLIKEQIKELDEKYDTGDKKGTIAILTRDNKQIDAIRELGLELPEGYAIETDKVQNLYKEPCTIDLYRLVLTLQYYTNPKYLYSLSLSNYAPTISKKVVYQNHEHRDLIRKAYEEDYIIDEWLKAKDPKEKKSILNALKEQAVLRVIRRIIKETKPWERYALQFNPGEARKEAALTYKRNLDLLLERITTQNNQEYLTLNNLAKQLYIKIFANQHEDERQVEQKNDKHRIKCLTVHKSKGLEYDHVIIPYTSGSMTERFANEVVIVHDDLTKEDIIYVTLVVKGKNEDIETSQQAVYVRSEYYNQKTKKEARELIKEETRVLYVALTRAKETVTWFEGNVVLEEDEDIEVTWSDLLKRKGEVNGK